MRVSVFYRTDPVSRRRKITRLIFVLAVLAIIWVGLAAAVRNARAGKEGGDGASDASDAGGVGAPSPAIVADAPAGSAVAAEPEVPQDAVVATAGSLKVEIGPVDVAVQRSFFDEARLERAASRAKHEETLADVLSDATIGPEARSRAQDALMNAADTARLEEVAESMLRTWGVEDAIVILGEAGASVAVKSGKLNRTAASAVGDIVHRATGINLARITIVERGR